MASLDEHLLLFLTVVPIVSAIFVALVPKFDMPSARQIAMTVLIIWLALLLRCGFLLFIKHHFISFHIATHVWFAHNNEIALALGPHEFILLLSLWFGFFNLFFLSKRQVEENGVTFATASLCLIAFSAVSILTTTIKTAIVSAHFGMTIVLYLVALFGGPYRGRATLISALFFLTVDVAALFVFFLPENLFQNAHSLIFWVCILPALARLLIPCTAPFLRSLFTNCPTELMALVIGTTVPIGAALFLHVNDFIPQADNTLTSTMIISGLVFFSTFFSALWAFSETNAQQISISLLMFHSSLFIAVVLDAHNAQSHLLGVSIIFCGILVSSFSLFASQLLIFEADEEPKKTLAAQLWLASITLWYPIPGIGVGTAIWMGLMHLAGRGNMHIAYTILWLVALLIYIASVTRHFCQHLGKSNVFVPFVELQSGILASISRAWIVFGFILIACAAVSFYLPRLGA